MSNDRLPTEFWVAAKLRQFNATGTGAYLVRRGDAERGSVIARLVDRDGARILVQVRDLDGRLAWMAVKEGVALPADEADAYITRAIARDSDVWVIEVETKRGENPFEGKLLGP
jgi:hypothetical protein